MLILSLRPRENKWISHDLIVDGTIILIWIFSSLKLTLFHCAYCLQCNYLCISLLETFGNVNLKSLGYLCFTHALNKKNLYHKATIAMHFYFISCLIFSWVYFSARSSRRFHFELCWWWEALGPLIWGFSFSWAHWHLILLATPVEMLFRAGNGIAGKTEPAPLHHLQMHTSCAEIHSLKLGGTSQTCTLFLFLKLGSLHSPSTLFTDLKSNSLEIISFVFEIKRKHLFFFF